MEQAPKKSREASSPTKGRGRPKGSKNKSKSQAIVKTKFGAIIPNLPPHQRKALGNLLFAGSAPNTAGKLPNSILQADGLNAGRQLPQNDVKSDHLLFKEVHLVKNTTTGDWEVESVTTNQGKFETGVEQTKKINQALVRAFVTYLRQHVFENDIKTFLEQEKL